MKLSPPSLNLLGAFFAYSGAAYAYSDRFLLEEAAPFVYEFELEANRSYSFSDCSGVKAWNAEIKIFDPSGTLVAWDALIDADPIICFKACSSGLWSIRVTMVESPFGQPVLTLILDGACVGAV